MNQPRKILIIEDEHDISRILKDYMKMNGFDVLLAEDGQAGLDWLETDKPDFIILDLTLPDVDGIELCRRIREKNNAPILILSARGSDTDKVLGLGFGADDYMTKPFSLSELMARINAHLRRNDSLRAELHIKQDEEKLLFGSLVIDKKAYRVTVDHREIALSAKEFELLYFLARHKNQVFSKSKLLDEIWGYSTYGDENTITVYIRRLREKIEADPSKPLYLKTVWGIGYKFSVD